MMSYKDMGSGRSGIEEGRTEEGTELDGDKRGKTGVEEKKDNWEKGRMAEEDGGGWMDGGLEIQMRDEKDRGNEKVSDQKKVERAGGLKIVIGW